MKIFSDFSRKLFFSKKSDKDGSDSELAFQLWARSLSLSILMSKMLFSDPRIVVTNSLKRSSHNPAVSSVFSRGQRSLNPRIDWQFLRDDCVCIFYIYFKENPKDSLFFSLEIPSRLSYSQDNCWFSQSSLVTRSPSINRVWSQFRSKGSDVTIFVFYRFSDLDFSTLSGQIETVNLPLKPFENSQNERFRQTNNQ